MGPYSTADVYIIVDPNITVGRATEVQALRLIISW
jgi:hypothetical protein